MSDLIRDTPLGHIIRLVTRNSRLQYPEERPGFRLPETYASAIGAAQFGFKVERDGSRYPSFSNSQNKPSSEELSDQTLSVAKPISDPAPRVEPVGRVEDPSISRDQMVPTSLSDDIILVDWYGPTDPANPQN